LLERVNTFSFAPTHAPTEKKNAGAEAAFNRAFKKLVGTPPATWRKTRGNGAAPSESRI
jgi:hypothetical protein